MSDINLQPISTLSPLEIVYSFAKNETLKNTPVIYKSGYHFNNLAALNYFQDITFANDSCFVLTSSVSLSSFFVPDSDKQLGKLTGSVILRSQEGEPNEYVGYDDTNNTITKSTLPVLFLIYPVNNTEVELKVNGSYVQVDGEYPFKLRLNKKSLNINEIHRQRFTYFYQNNILTLKTLTSAGYRYISLTKDGTMKAAGLILNDSTVHNYALLAYEVTTDKIQYGFKPENTWITYFQDFESQSNNENLFINKKFLDTPINFLLNFELKPSITTGKAYANIANLKTQFTPTGGPAPVDNSY